MRVFNKANQAIGEPPRRALAAAASSRSRWTSGINPSPASFGPVMRRIAHKHVSLGMNSYEYPIVGRHLLVEAIGDVLGDAVTPEVAAARDAVASWLFGCQLIAEEARLYALGGTDPEQPWRQDPG